jgi:hypothetical protein
VRAYDPRTASLLAAAVRKRLKANGGTARPLILSHPSGEAVVASREIRRHLALSGISVELQEHTGARDFPAQSDLFYAELSLSAPARDLPAVLDAFGLSRNLSPAAATALRQLQAARGADDIAARAVALSRALCDDDLVIPLWQTVEHFAYRVELKGIRPGSDTLYQDVGEWQLPLIWDE